MNYSRDFLYNLMVPNPTAKMIRKYSIWDWSYEVRDLNIVIDSFFMEYETAIKRHKLKRWNIDIT